MATQIADISVEHFGWLVDGRSRNQLSTFALYRIIESENEKLRKNVELGLAAQQLASIAFSLWRAVFLSDTTGEYADQWADVRHFLTSLISDNTVVYATDKNARNWSFRYYLENATNRLTALADSELGILDRGALLKTADAEKDEWLNAQSALENALANFERIVKST